ncbi:hypothetical protein [Mycobacterium avium]|uniref:hypothetical protein n=1 Tax=Mycobacterium avium TaxID=1764 RepID=UPI0004B7B43E|nr:hypothetical protein [Mycobacterium avium]
MTRFESNDTPANETIQLGMLTPQLKLEMQYVLQQRHDDRRGKLTPTVVARVVRLLIDTATTSLLDFDADEWRQRSAVLLNDTRSRGLLLYAHSTVLDLAEAGGWKPNTRATSGGCTGSAMKATTHCGSTAFHNPG